MKEYYIDTYAKTLECEVLRVEKTDKGLEVYTDKTICYPECGGQPGDMGTLGTNIILDTKKANNGDSVHIVKTDSEIQIEQKLTMTLDWEHRYKYMVMHTAQHMLSGMLFNLFGIGTVSVHLGKEYLTIETNCERIDVETTDKLVSLANDKIAEAHRIIYHEMNHEAAEALGMRRSIKVDGDVRIVEIEGVDKIACGGVHVATTSEIRMITYLGQEKIRNHVRLFFACGKEAQNLACENRKLLESLMRKLNCSSFYELESKADKTVFQLSEYKIKLDTLSKTAAKQEILSKIKNQAACFETDLELEYFVQVCEEYDNISLCVQRETNWLIILKGENEKTDFNLIKEKILVPNNAKGGGKNGFYRGSCQNSIVESFRTFIKEEF